MKKIWIFALLLIGVIVLGIATSYAMFMIHITKDTEFKVVVGNLELSITPSDTEDKIIMDQLVPKRDEDALKEDGYTFTITNTGTIDSYYTLYLDDIMLDSEKERLKDSWIRMNLYNHKSRVSSTKYMSDFLPENEKKLDHGILKKGESITYTLRLWLAYEVGNEAQDKYYATQIRVVGEQKNSVELPYDVTLNLQENNYLPNYTANGTAYFQDIVITESDKLIFCNNGAIPKESDNGGIEVGNVTSDTSCKILDSFQKMVNSIDDSKNHILLLNDIEEKPTEVIQVRNKNFVLDLNGKVIIFRPQHTLDRIIHYFDSEILLESSKDSGGMILDVGNSKLFTAFMRIQPINSQKKFQIKSGYYFSNTASTYHGVIEASGANSKLGTTVIVNIDGEVADACTSDIHDYHTGLCIYGLNTCALKNNGSAINNTFNIKGGTFYGGSSAYLTDALGGSTNIYGGDFYSNSSSIGTTSNDNQTQINICGGNFYAPTDLNLDSNTIQVHYQNNNRIHWYHPMSPTVLGKYPENVILDEAMNCDTFQQ